MSGNAIATYSAQTRYEKKKKSLRQAAQQLPDRTVILFEDETDLVLFPPLGAGWAKRGQPAPVHLCGANARRTIFGLLNIRTGHRVLLESRRQRAADFQRFLFRVRRHYRGWNVAMVLDGDSSHTAKSSLKVAQALGIQLFWLPIRAPELNPMENLWREGKRNICVNRQYGSIEQQVRSFIGYLEGLSNYQTLVKSGVLSGNFWLWK